MRENSFNFFKVVGTIGIVIAGAILLGTIGLFAYVASPDPLPILIDDVLAGAGGVAGTIGTVVVGAISLLSFLGGNLTDSTYGTVTTNDGKCYSYNYNTYSHDYGTERIGSIFDDNGNSYSFNDTTYSYQ